MPSAAQKINSGFKTSPLSPAVNVVREKKSGVISVNTAGVIPINTIRKGSYSFQKPSSFTLSKSKGWCMPEEPDGYIKPAKHNLL